MRVVPMVTVTWNVPAGQAALTGGRRGGATLTSVFLTGSALLAGLFAWLTYNVFTSDAWQEFDVRWAVDMKACAEERPALRNALAALTFFGGIRCMTVVALATGFWQLRQGRRALALAIPLLALAGGLFDLSLKEFLDRERPPAEWRDAVVKETNESFPSGHSMGSVVGYGLLAYVILLQDWRPRWKILAIGALIPLVLVVGFSRIYLRAHWFTDVAAGFTIGAAWLALAVAILERLRGVGAVVVDVAKANADCPS